MAKRLRSGQIEKIKDLARTTALTAKQIAERVHCSEGGVTKYWIEDRLPVSPEGRVNSTVTEVAASNAESAKRSKQFWAH